MYHITSKSVKNAGKKKKEQFYNVLIARNGKVLNTSEMFTTKKRAIGNLRATAIEMQTSVVFQDDTVKNPSPITMDTDGTYWENSFNTEPIYVPGKNPTRKKK